MTAFTELVNQVRGSHFRRVKNNHVGTQNMANVRKGLFHKVKFKKPSREVVYLIAEI